MNIKDIEKRLTALANGEKCKIIKVCILINKKYDSMGAYLVIFVCGGDLNCSCVVYEDGTLMHLRDWQSGYPKNGKEIKNYDWITEDGRMTIMFHGLPRVI